MTARRVTAAAFAVLLALALVLALVGVSLLPLMSTAAAAWVLVIAARWGAGLGLAAGLLGAALLALVVLVLTPVVGLPLLASSIVVWSGVGVGALLVLARSNTEVPAPAWRAGAQRWAPSAVGAAVWVGAMLAGTVMRSASQFSWVMMGDSANNLLFARETIYDNGILLGAAANPVPLPSAAIALAMVAGRSSTPAAGLLEHDIASFALVWGLLIALTCFLAGAASVSVMAPARRWLSVVVGAGVSFIPLSWLVTGYPIEYGFFNTHLALPIVFLSWIAANSAPRHPQLSLAALLAASTLILATWSPLVLLPLMLAVLVVVRHRRELLASRGAGLALVLIGAAQLAVYGLVSTLPSLLAQGGFLTGVGGIIPFPRYVIVAAAIGTLAVVVVAFLRGRRDAALALAAVLVAGAVGIGALLFLNRNQPDIWTYYPTKLAWLMTIIFGVLALGTFLSALPPVRKRVGMALFVVVSLATFGALYAVPKLVPSFGWRDPVPRIVTDDFAVGDAVAERIFALSDPDHPTLLWQTGDPAEGSINFWLLQMRADSTSERRELRVYAYGHGETVQDLCQIVEAMGPPVTVRTANVDLAAEAAGECGDDVVVTMETG